MKVITGSDLRRVRSGGMDKPSLEGLVRDNTFPARKYIKNMFNAFTANWKNLFDGENSYYGRLGSQKEAHKRAFYDIGTGLADFSKKEQIDAMQISYGDYVKFCGLKPLLNAKETHIKMQEGIDGRKGT